MDPVTFPFRFAEPYRRAARLFGITPETATVTVGDHELDAHYGPWRVITAIANISEVEVTGPYAMWRTAGPARFSFADRGVTFASNGDRGVCLSFTTPMPGLEPTGLLRHPNLTVTVADCEGLADLVRARSTG